MEFIWVIIIVAGAFAAAMLLNALPALRKSRNPQLAVARKASAGCANTGLRPRTERIFLKAQKTGQKQKIV